MTDPAIQQGNGHCFARKTFHKPTFCHHCSDLLWGLSNQGQICSGCGFVSHDRCLENIVIPCTTIAQSRITIPVAHSLFGPVVLKRKFCNVCRQRFDETEAFACKVCYYFIHVDCRPNILQDCKEVSTFTEKKMQRYILQPHHWREGGMHSGSSKCNVCKKTCGSSECLTGMRCSWCNSFVHSWCQKDVNKCCDFGSMAPLVLPPYALSVASIPLWLTRSAEMKMLKSGSVDSGHGSAMLAELFDEKSELANPSATQGSSTSVLRIYDGDPSCPHGWRNVKVPKDATSPDVLKAALKKFRIADEADKYFLVRAVSETTERRLEDYEKPMNFVKNGRPQLFLRHNSFDLKHGKVKVYSSMIRAKVPVVGVLVNRKTQARKILEKALQASAVEDADFNQYCLVEYQISCTGVKERFVDNHECLWEMLVEKRKQSIEEFEMTRFYIQPRLAKDASTSTLISNLPLGWSKAQYETAIIDAAGCFNEFMTIERVFSNYGSVLLKFSRVDSFLAYYPKLRDCLVEGRPLTITVLPVVHPEVIPSSSSPLLIFVNGKSGSGQGLKLLHAFQRILNPLQVVNLMDAGPLPGLCAFRNLEQFRILICGGDGTFGWVLSCLEEVKFSLLRCDSPPCALLPLGTGNDLSRVFNWGSGYNGTEDIYSILHNVSTAVEVNFDRWNIVFDSKQDGQEDSTSESIESSQFDDLPSICVMNNYFGIGVDAALCLEFHLAREESPDKFNSRLRNKGVYFRAGLRNLGKNFMSNIQEKIELKVDGKVINLPSIEGLLLLNISSWGAGADPWGKEKDERFATPSSNDGLLEVVGLTGVVHMGRIKSGISTGMRIAQGAQIDILLKSDLPVQIDGEPWLQPKGSILVRPTAREAQMLYRPKRRGTYAK